MVIINSYSNKRFTLNGIQYLKNYVSRVSGNRVQVYNCYDNCDVLAGYDIYSNYIVNGETFSNAALLQEALLDVIFSRGTLGNDVGELIQDNKRLVKDVTIATTDTETQILAKINALPLYLVDEHSLVSYRCYNGGERVLVYNTIGLGKGSYGIGGTQLTLANLLKVYEYVPYINQNNIHRVHTYATQDTGNIPSTSQVAMLINSHFLISFSETDIPWIAVNMLGTSPLKKHIYWFTGGKGLWGGPEIAGGATVNRGMLQYVLTQNATPQDIQDGGNTSVIPLGVLPDGDYISTANAIERDLSNPDLYYFLKFTVDGAEYLLQFTGSDYGMYGGSNTLQFTESDFEEMPVAEAPEPFIPNLQQVTTQGGSTDQPITTSDGVSTTEIQPTGGVMLKRDNYKITLMLDPTNAVYESFDLLVPCCYSGAGSETLVFQSTVVSTPGRPVIRSKTTDYTSISELETGDEISHRVGNLIIHSAIYNGGDPDNIENLSILLATEI